MPLTTGFGNALVASSRPPNPTSITATSTFSCHKPTTQYIDDDAVFLNFMQLSSAYLLENVKPKNCQEVEKVKLMRWTQLVVHCPKVTSEFILVQHSPIDSDSFSHINEMWGRI
jgi:hypothetical protein